MVEQSKGYYKGVLIGVNVALATELQKQENPQIRKIYNLIKGVL